MESQDSPRRGFIFRAECEAARLHARNTGWSLSVQIWAAGTLSGDEVASTIPRWLGRGNVPSPCFEHLKIFGTVSDSERTSGFRMNVRFRFAHEAQSAEQFSLILNVRQESEKTPSPSREAAVKNCYYSLILADILVFISLVTSYHCQFFLQQEMKRTKCRNSRSDLF